ncbi:hypothetical protein FALBO_5985 [Fusarium albosuccineum]|uniref:Uncharacterized protein n=1 Tax=Fusarium albosuccineum TaxID=1237068 RepID=A0A8H4PC64_9HYPO|nr:hypothetical protein FALBO_5985 [Fusarium albosuccineum]
MHMINIVGFPVSEKDECNFKRLSPDFYSWNRNKEAYNAAPDFASKVIYTLLNDRHARILSTFNQPPRIDVVSGESYYIRSKSNPEFYWLEKDGQIWATKSGRTRFILRIDGSQEKDKTVLIAKDEISLTAVGGPNQKYVSVSDNGELVLGGHSCRMYFGDLKKNFLAQGEHGMASPSLPITRFEGNGEEWELVK